MAQLAIDLACAADGSRPNWPPAWPPTVFYASGTNDPGEIRGFAALGIPIGFCAAVVSTAALAEMERLGATRLLVFGDTGAYGEVSAAPARRAVPRLAATPGALTVVRPMTAADWEARLEVYGRVAHLFRDRFAAVAPDRVGDQEETLARLLTYRERVRDISRLGTEILVPLHSGRRSLDEFHREAQHLLGVPATPAFPMPKGGTTGQDVLRFVASASPRRIHLLGLGLRSRRARDLLPVLRFRAPGLRVSMDANLITAAVGRRPDGTAARPLTAAQDLIRRRGFSRAHRDTRDVRWGIHADYTDSIASPSAWLGPVGLEAVAAAVGLSAEQRRRWKRDADAFLQEPLHAAGDSPRWWEAPAMEHALESAWLRHLHRLHTAPRKAEAIQIAFRNHPAAGQLSAQAPRGDPRRVA